MSSIISNTRKPLWTVEEEKNFIKDVSNGIPLENLSSKYNRTLSALDLRLKKFIFTNIENGKSEQKMARILNLPQDKIKQFYYEYKGFLEKKEKIKEINKIDKSNQIDKNNEIKGNKFEKKLARLEKENIAMKNIIDNYKLHKEMGKLIKHKVFNESVMDKINDYLHST